MKTCDSQKKSVAHFISLDFLFSLADGKGMERSLDTGDIMETMRGFLENSDLAKLFFTDSGAGVTINLWPWIISSILLLVCESPIKWWWSGSGLWYSAFPLLAGILSNLHVPAIAFYKAMEQNYGHGRNDYDDYYDEYDSYDRWVMMTGECHVTQCPLQIRLSGQSQGSWQEQRQREEQGQGIQEAEETPEGPVQGGCNNDLGIYQT